MLATVAGRKRQRINQSRPSRRPVVASRPGVLGGTSANSCSLRYRVQLGGYNPGRIDVDLRSLTYKALAEERFKWPGPSDALLTLTGEQINWLLDGYDISLLQGHKKLHYTHLG